ncbi:MAG: sensor histidine kinase [Solirubrobacteraceae bacterium]
MRSRWVTLLLICRLPAAGVSVALLLIHHVSDRDAALVAATIAWTALTLLAATHWPPAQHSRMAWALDGGVALALTWLSGDWRRPFYVFGLTALILPATSLPFRAALGWGAAYALAYLAVGIVTELGPGALQDPIRLETAATHVLVPMMVTIALAYAAALVQQLRSERERSERFAVQAERQRIAWDLHDSAKQRIHAAHLVLSATAPQLPAAAAPAVDQVLGELRAAGADMDTSVAELRAPLDGRPVDELLRARAAELQRGTTARIEVRGDLPPLPPLVAAHTFRIASEALTNAVRHAGAQRIEVELDRAQGGRIRVRDDGAGLPAHARPGSSGLRAMRNRAQTIGASLELGPGAGGAGTAMTLTLPTAQGDPA